MDSNTIGNVVDYADAPETTWVTGWNQITLNTTACGDINALSVLKIALVNYTYDYLYQNPPPGDPGTNVGNGINAATNPPYLEIETGVGQWVLSINPALVSNVNTVPEANIKFVNRAGAIGLFRGSTGGIAGPSNPACGTAGSGAYTQVYAQYGISTPVGGIVYTDVGLTTPFNGSALYWPVNEIPSSYSGGQWQISATGTIMDDTQSCLF